jgi:hypothetical protein
MVSDPSFLSYYSSAKPAASSSANKALAAFSPVGSSSSY